MASRSISQKKKQSPLKPCYVYVIQVDSGAIKIGKSFNPLGRVSGIQTGNHEEARLVFSFELPTDEAATALERVLHERYADRRLRREWFAVDPNHVIEDIRFTVAFARLVKSIEYAEFNHITDEMRTAMYNNTQTIWGLILELKNMYEENIPVREGNELKNSRGDRS